MYEGRCSFEITELRFQTSVGTYLDAPAHTTLLGEGILLVENLRGLDALHGRRFWFFAVPIPAVEPVAIPVRAFAEVHSGE